MYGLKYLKTAFKELNQFAYVILQYHDEYMRVIEGRLEVTLEGKKHTITPSDGQLLIKKGQIHSLRIFKGERMVLEERTSPPGDYKARYVSSSLI